MPFIAHHFDLGLCPDPKCRAVHFQLFDEFGTLKAAMTMVCESVPRIAKKMQDLAYEIAATKEGGE